MKKLLFVVHRYGYPGGSENNTKRMAEAAVKLGHEVWVLADIHQGDQNGVKVTNNHGIVSVPFDAIIVHGSCPTQDFIHANSEYISQHTPIYYIIIQPSDSQISQLGMKHAKWIGCGTSFDWAHVEKYGHKDKGRQFIYGIEDVRGTPTFKERFGITTKKMYLSAGGFWPHKQFGGIVDAFNRASIPDTTLVLLGYDAQHGQIPPASKYVVPILGTTQQDVYDAMADADLYILNSDAEGYGLVLLEAMYNGCPWISRPVAAGFDLADEYGSNYNTQEELITWMKAFHSAIPRQRELNENVEYVKNNHLAVHSINSILEVLN